MVNLFGPPIPAVIDAAAKGTVGFDLKMNTVQHRCRVLWWCVREGAWHERQCYCLIGVLPAAAVSCDLLLLVVRPECQFKWTGKRGSAIWIIPSGMQRPLCLMSEQKHTLLSVSPPKHRDNNPLTARRITTAAPSARTSGQPVTVAWCRRPLYGGRIDTAQTLNAAVRLPD